MREDNIVVVDLDNTLYDISHRSKYYGSDWDEYNELIPEDILDEDLADLVKILCKVRIVVFLTGRYEKYRSLTEDKLLSDGFEGIHLIMKSDDDNLSSVIFKNKFIEIHKDKISLVIDDRDEIIENCKKLKLNILIPKLKYV